MSGRKGPVLGAAAAAAVTAAVVVGFTLTTGVDWFYDRPVTMVAVMVTVVLATLITRRLLPRAWRPAGVLPVLVAAVSAYVFLRVSVSAGWTEAVDHGVLERLEGEVDDLPTWAFAGAGAAAVLCFVTLLNRWSGGRSGDDEPA